MRRARPAQSSPEIHATPRLASASFSWTPNRASDQDPWHFVDESKVPPAQSNRARFAIIFIAPCRSACGTEIFRGLLLAGFHQFGRSLRCCASLVGHARTRRPTSALPVDRFHAEGIADASVWKLGLADRTAAGRRAEAQAHRYPGWQAVSQFALRSRFDKARTLANVDFQFRDIRAKAVTDTGDLVHSQTLLGHNNRDMTEHYVKS